MEDTTQSVETSELTPTPEKPKKSNKKVLLIVAAVLLATAPALGVYMWQKNTNSKPATVTSGAKSSLNVDVAHQTAKDIFPTSKIAPTYDPSTVSTDTTVGYPRNLPSKLIKTTLVLPGGYGIVADWPKSRDQAELNSNYVTAYNDVMAYWKYNLKGIDKSPSAPLTSDFKITAFNEWLKENDKSDYYYETSSFHQEGSPMDTAQKQTFVNELKNKTANCAKDSSKGFVTDDGVYNVCYTVSSGHAVGANSIMSVEGYADVEGTLLYMRSFIDLPNSSSDATSVAQVYVQALKKIHTTVEAR